LLNLQQIKEFAICCKEMIFRFSLRLIFIFLLGFNSIHLYSQTEEEDTVVVVKYDSVKFVNGSKQAAKIIEISDKYVKYKNPKDLNGPTYSVKKRDIAGFVFADGCLDLKQFGYDNCIKDPNADLVKDENFKNKVLSIDLFQLTSRHFQLNFDYFFKNKKQGLSFYGNVGFLDQTDSETYERWETKVLFSGKMYKKYYFGFDFKLFPAKHRKLTYVYSFGADIGRSFLMEKKNILGGWYYDPSLGYNTFHSSYSKDFMIEGLYSSLRLTNGFIWRITNSIFLQCGVTLGANYYKYYSIVDETDVNLFLPKVSGTVLLGFAL